MGQEQQVIFAENGVGNDVMNIASSPVCTMQWRDSELTWADGRADIHDGVLELWTGK